jgi:hypothetical protein
MEEPMAYGTMQGFTITLTTSSKGVENERRFDSWIRRSFQGTPVYNTCSKAAVSLDTDTTATTSKSACVIIVRYVVRLLLSKALTDAADWRLFTTLSISGKSAVILVDRHTVLG